MNKYYTGVGSRDLPPEVAPRIRLISIALYKRGYRVRSGGANGTDLAFQANGFAPGDIYLPWKNFNKEVNRMVSKDEGGQYRYIEAPKLTNWYEALEILDDVRPLVTLPERTHRLLHGRNVYQVLGDNLNDPSSFLICWTLDGKVAGGTATAIKIAQNYNVPVINLAIEKFDISKLEEYEQRHIERWCCKNLPL